MACLAVLRYGDDSTLQQLPAVVCGRFPTCTHTHLHTHRQTCTHTHTYTCTHTHALQFARCVPGVQNSHYSRDYFAAVKKKKKDLQDLGGLSASFPNVPAHLHICRLARETRHWPFVRSLIKKPLHSMHIYHLVSRELKPSTSSLPGVRRHHSNQPPACLTSIIPDQLWVVVTQHTMTRHRDMSRCDSWLSHSTGPLTWKEEKQETSKIILKVENVVTACVRVGVLGWSVCLHVYVWVCIWVCMYLCMSLCVSVLLIFFSWFSVLF